MRTICIAILASGALLFSRCQSPSDKIVESFQKVTTSLEKSVEQVEDSYTSQYKAIKKDSTHPALVEKADLVYGGLRRFIVFTDSLKKLLPAEDPANTEIPRKIFVNSATEKSINTAMATAHDKILAGLVNKSKKTQVDSLMKRELKYIHQRGWTKEQFDGAPAGAVNTTLVLFRMHVESAATLAMQDIYAALK